MQITISAEWKTYDSVLHNDKEIVIAGLKAGLWSEGDSIGWVVAVASSNRALVCGRAADYAAAQKDAEDAIRNLLDVPGPEAAREGETRMQLRR